MDSTQCAGGARPAKTERTKRRRLLSIEVRREVENNTGLGEAGADRLALRQRPALVDMLSGDTRTALRVMLYFNRRYGI